MKKIIYILFLIIFALTYLNKSFAQTKTPTPSDGLVQQQIDDLKNKIASKVAELNLVEKRGVLGTVTDSSDTQITLSDVSGNIKNIDVDELTKFYSSSSDNFGISDIKRGQTLGILGLYNKQSQRILAREVNAESEVERIIYGVILKKDAANFEFTIVDFKGNKSVIEIQDITKSYIYSLDKLDKSGFSKTDILETIIAVGLPDKQSPGKILATRLIILPKVNLSAKLNLSNELDNQSATPSGK